MTEPLRVSGRTHRGGRPDRKNEDAYAVVRSERWVAAFVADGMGGRAGGRAAARIGVRAAARACSEAMTGDIAEALHAGADAAREAVLAERERSDGALRQMASTLVGAITDGRSAAVVWLGDSRAYLLRGRRALPLTEDHVTWRDGRWLVARYLGSAIAEPEARLLRVRPGDRILLCSDGLLAPSGAGAHIAALASSGPPVGAARALVRAAVRAGTRDNVTAVVIALPDPARAAWVGLSELSQRWGPAGRGLTALARAFHNLAVRLRTDS